MQVLGVCKHHSNPCRVIGLWMSLLTRRLHDSGDHLMALTPVLCRPSSVGGER